MRLQLPFLIVVAAVTQAFCTQGNLTVTGNYVIRHCGAAGTRSNTDNLLALLPYFTNQLQIVLADIRLGIRSKAFRAFFKTQASVPGVESVFREMAAGYPIALETKGRNLNQPPYEHPSLICLDPSLPDYDSKKTYCEGHEAFVPHRGGAQVQLCPDYWHLTRDPSTEQCAAVRRNRFTDNGDWDIIYNQFGVFIHEMSHLYAAAWDPEMDRIRGLNECVDLSPQDSTKAAQNYALYAASKFLIFYLIPSWISYGY
ncbi:MAG: hypothetical protein Q9186_007004 [Xanthomendoza sp. 1 TL-2023]